MTDRREQLRQRVSSLNGQSISIVRYFDLSTETEEGYWHRAEHVDVVSFGVDLVIGSETYSVTWDRAFASYNIAIERRSLVESLGAGSFWRVEKSPPWSGVLGQAILEASIHWSEHPNESADNPYPLALSLRFEGGSVLVLAAAYVMEDEGDFRLMAGGDEPAVISDAEVAAHLLPEVLDLIRRIRPPPA